MKKRLSLAKVALLTGVVSISTAAAQTPAEITTTLTDKVTTYAPIMIGVCVAIVGFKILKRMINKA